MNILCVIPARSGSKSVQKKNIRLIKGYPLIYYTIKEALKIKGIRDIVLSTDSRKFQQIGLKYGAQSPFIRPKNLSTDKSLTSSVVMHCLKFMEKKLKLQYDSILLLQPTSPLRKAKHISKAIKIFSNKKTDSVVSVVKCNSYHPFRMKRITNGSLINYIDQGQEDMRPRQKLPNVYIRNGAIYMTKRDMFLKNESLVNGEVKPLIMNDEESINIDSEIDFQIAENLM